MRWKFAARTTPIVLHWASLLPAEGQGEAVASQMGPGASLHNHFLLRGLRGMLRSYPEYVTYT